MADKDEGKEKEKAKVDVEGSANGGVTIRLNKTALTALITAIAGFVFNYYNGIANKDETKETNKGAYEYTQRRLDALERQVEMLTKAIIEGKADKVSERKPAASPSRAPASSAVATEAKGVGSFTFTKAKAKLRPKYDDFVQMVQTKGQVKLEEIEKTETKEEKTDPAE